MPLTDVIGQPRAMASLSQAFARGRLPHALLLHGPAGVGKRDAALRIAQALLCPEAPGAGCGACSSCRRAAQGIHPDLCRLERDGAFIRVEAARELVRTSILRPYEGRAKVYLIEEAEALNDESANTLLKTLEEPPAKTYLILITGNPQALMATLRSRCQGIAFTALGRADLERLLVERHGLDPGEARLRVRLAPGSQTRALAVDPAAERDARAVAASLLAALAAPALDPATATRLLEHTEALAKKPGATESFLFGTLRALARDALVLAFGSSGSGSEPGSGSGLGSASGPERLLVDDRDIEPLRALARTVGVEVLSDLLGEIDRAEAALRVNANKRLLLEAVLLGVYLGTRQRRT